MKLKHLPLLLFVAASIGFMAFLVVNSGVEKIACDKPPCRKKAPDPKPVNSGGSVEEISGSINHLIVSTIR